MMTAPLNHEPRVEDLEDRIKKRFQNEKVRVTNPSPPEAILSKGYYGNRVSAAELSISRPDTLKCCYSAHKYTAKQLEQIAGLWNKHLMCLQEDIDRIMPSFSVPTSMEIIYHQSITFSDSWKHRVVLTMEFPHMSAHFLLKCAGERSKHVKRDDGSGMIDKIVPPVERFRADLPSLLAKSLRDKLETEKYPESLHDPIVEMFLQTLDEEHIQQIPTDMLCLGETKDTDWQFIGIGSRKKGQKRIIVDENRFKRPGIEVIPVVINKYHNYPRVFALIDEEWWTCTRRNRNPVKHIEHRRMTRLDEDNMYTIGKLEEIMMGLFAQSEDE